MKKCPFCGASLSSTSSHCPRCGVELKNDTEVLEAEVMDKTYSDSYYIEENRLEEYARRAKSAYNLSIVSVLLCCCTITSIISFVLSIVLLVDLNKMSEDIKYNETYRKIKNKTIVALVISSIIIFLGIFNAIDSIVNADKYSEMYNSLMNEMLSSGVYE